MVGPPKVINKKVDDKLQEPFEVIFVARQFLLLFSCLGKTRVIEMLYGLYTHGQL